MSFKESFSHLKMLQKILLVAFLWDLGFLLFELLYLFNACAGWECLVIEGPLWLITNFYAKFLQGLSPIVGISLIGLSFVVFYYPVFFIAISIYYSIKKGYKGLKK